MHPLLPPDCIPHLCTLVWQASHATHSLIHYGLLNYQN